MIYVLWMTQVIHVMYGLRHTCSTLNNQHQLQHSENINGGRAHVVQPCNKSPERLVAPRFVISTSDHHWDILLVIHVMLCYVQCCFVWQIVWWKHQCFSLQLSVASIGINQAQVVGHIFLFCTSLVIMCGLVTENSTCGIFISFIFDGPSRGCWKYC